MTLKDVCLPSVSSPLPSPPLSCQLMVYVQKVLNNRKVREQQQLMANQVNYLQQLAAQNGMLGGVDGTGLSQTQLLNLYQQLHGISPFGNMNPGPSKGL